MSLQRLLPLSGVAILVLAIVGFMIAGDTPRSDANAAEGGCVLCGHLVERDRGVV